MGEMNATVSDHVDVPPQELMLAVLGVVARFPRRGGYDVVGEAHDTAGDSISYGFDTPNGERVEVRREGDRRLTVSQVGQCGSREEVAYLFEPSGRGTRLTVSRRWVADIGRAN